MAACRCRNICFSRIALITSTLWNVVEIRRMVCFYGYDLVFMLCGDYIDAGLPSRLARLHIIKCIKRFAKGGVSSSERAPFTLQDVAFCKVKGHILLIVMDERSVTGLVIAWLSVVYGRETAGCVECACYENCCWPVISKVTVRSPWPCRKARLVWRLVSGSRSIRRFCMLS